MDDGEIARPDIVGVILKEGGPGLTRVPAALRHVSLYRSFADFDAQLEQFAANALCAPQAVRTHHCFDEVDGFLGDTRLRLPFSRFASSVQAEQIPMPAEKRVRLDDVQRLLPVSAEVSQQDETKPVAIRQFRLFGLPP